MWELFHNYGFLSICRGFRGFVGLIVPYLIEPRLEVLAIPVGSDDEVQFVVAVRVKHEAKPMKLELRACGAGAMG